MATHSSILAWRIPWTEEPGRLQSMRSQSWTQLSNFTFTFHFHILKSHPVWRSRHRKGDNWHKYPGITPSTPDPALSTALRFQMGQDQTAHWTVWSLARAAEPRRRPWVPWGHLHSGVSARSSRLAPRCLFLYDPHRNPLTQYLIKLLGGGVLGWN